MYPEVAKDNAYLLFHNRTGLDVSPEKDLKKLYVETKHLNSTMLKQTINQFRKSMTLVVDNKLTKSKKQFVSEKKEKRKSNESLSKSSGDSCSS